MVHIAFRLAWVALTWQLVGTQVGWNSSRARREAKIARGLKSAIQTRVRRPCPQHWMKQQSTWVFAEPVVNEWSARGRSGACSTKRNKPPLTLPAFHFMECTLGIVMINLRLNEKELIDEPINLHISTLSYFVARSHYCFSCNSCAASPVLWMHIPRIWYYSWFALVWSVRIDLSISVIAANTLLCEWKRKREPGLS